MHLDPDSFPSVLSLGTLILSALRSFLVFSDLTALLFPYFIHSAAHFRSTLQLESLLSRSLARSFLAGTVPPQHSLTRSIIPHIIAQGHHASLDEAAPQPCMQSSDADGPWFRRHPSTTCAHEFECHITSRPVRLSDDHCGLCSCPRS